MKNKRVNESKEITKIVLKNKDNKEEELEEGLIVTLSELDDGSSDISLRFCNLNIDEVSNIIYGLNLLTKEMLGSD